MASYIVMATEKIMSRKYVPSGWVRVKFADELPLCPDCEEEAYCEDHKCHFSDCPCIGPTQDDVIYKEFRGELYAIPSLNLPTKATLKKYGLSEEEYTALYESQGGICPICGRKDVLLVIDHEHAPRWKKMPADQRKLYVRGLLCSYCNQRRVGKGVTKQTAYNTYKYLQAYEKRRPK